MTENKLIQIRLGHIQIRNISRINNVKINLMTTFVTQCNPYDPKKNTNSFKFAIFRILIRICKTIIAIDDCNCPV